MSTRAEQVAYCLSETRSLTRTAEAMRTALENGDTEKVSALVEAQELGIWRLGRLLQGEEIDDVEAADMGLAELGEGASEADRSDAVRRAWLGEMARLAEVSRQNAVLVRDGLVMVQGMLGILTGQGGDYGRRGGGPVAFSGRA